MLPPPAPLFLKLYLTHCLIFHELHLQRHPSDTTPYCALSFEMEDKVAFLEEQLGMMAVEVARRDSMIEEIREELQHLQQRGQKAEVNDRAVVTAREEVLVAKQELAKVAESFLRQSSEYQGNLQTRDTAHRSRELLLQEENSKLRAELAHTKQQLADAQKQGERSPLKSSLKRSVSPAPSYTGHATVGYTASPVRSSSSRSAATATGAGVGGAGTNAGAGDDDLHALLYTAEVAVQKAELLTARPTSPALRPASRR